MLSPPSRAQPKRPALPGTLLARSQGLNDDSHHLHQGWTVPSPSTGEFGENKTERSPVLQEK